MIPLRTQYAPWEAPRHNIEVSFCIHFTYYQLVDVGHQHDVEFVYSYGSSMLHLLPLLTVDHDFMMTMP